MARKRASCLVWITIVVLVVLFFLPCVQRVRDTYRWTYAVNDAREIAHGFQIVHDVNGRLPPAVVSDKDGRALFGWRVLLLPYLEQDWLYRQFRHDEPWDGPNNGAFAARTVKTFDTSLGHDGPGLTRLKVFVGSRAAFETTGLTWADFPDGRENTFLFVEAAEPVPWASPRDLKYRPEEPLPEFGSGAARPLHFCCRVVGRRPGFAAGFADGSARFIRLSADEAFIRAMITRNGGEAVDPSSLE